MVRKKTTKRGKTCFVIIGYGIKIDYPTGRQLDLDKTYQNIIEPVCKQLKIDCFRAKDIAINGIIDKSMYSWIYNADVVIADISTLNANALYELGVRHALRPYSTIVISEKELKYPFDIEHTFIDRYEHLGKDIGVTESNRFKKELKSKLRQVLAASSTDSPVYTYLNSLQPPRMLPDKRNASTTRMIKYPSVSELINDAENAKNRKEYDLAIKILSAALKYDANNQFIIQRLVLSTYKSEKPNKIIALKRALRMIKKLNPDQTTDPETLGLCGAIHKRLFEETGKQEYLKSALWYYERGFYIAQDYYNGLNVSHLHDQLASLAKTKNEAIHHAYQANIVRDKVIVICNKLLKSKTFATRSDKEWIFQTIYQALLGNGLAKKAKPYMKLIIKYSKGGFDLDTFQKHLKRLIDAKEIIKKKFKI